MYEGLRSVLLPPPAFVPASVFKTEEMQLPAAHSGENTAVDRVSGKPQLCKLDTLAELMPFPFREDFLLALVNFQSAGISYF